jgi:hypothetical protein
MAMLAWIIPVESGSGLTPTHPIVLPPQQPPGIWPSPGYPAHPIAPGGPPPGIWPSPGHPEHPIYFPPTGIWPSPGYPAHPIAPGGPPPGIWPSPGYPSHPIYWPPSIWPSPGFPAHPIAPGGAPPSIWPNPPEGSVSPDNPVNRPPGDSPMWKQVYIPGVGFIWAIVPPDSTDSKPQVNPLEDKER